MRPRPSIWRVPTSAGWTNPIWHSARRQSTIILVFFHGIMYTRSMEKEKRRPGRPKGNATEVLQIKITPEARAALEAMAKAENRTMRAVIERLILSDRVPQ